MDHGINTEAIVVVSACLVLWSLFSARLSRWFVSAPLAFVVLGVVVSHPPLDLVRVDLHSSTIRSVAELTLALVLFSDASRVNGRELATDAGLPSRLLGVGLPLTIGAGAGLALAVLPGTDGWTAAAVAAIVAPTDAALGASVMEDRRVPARVRRLLNVESGLNDGIVTPFVNFFLAGALSTELAHTSGALGAARELLVGLATGLGMGVVGGLLLRVARQRGWSDAGFRPFMALGLALLAYAGALGVHGNGFVSAFVAGMAFGSVGVDELEATVELTEEAGELLSLLVWFIFGASVLVTGLEAASWRDLAFAALALTVARMLPVAVALLGSGLDRRTTAFVGWFGPRGLASIVFGLIAYDSLAPGPARTVLAAVTTTVAVSVLAHGVSASPLAARYGAHAEGLHPARPERAPAEPVRARALVGHRRRRTKD